MNKKTLLLAAMSGLILSSALNWRNLHSCLMDADSFNAVTAFFLGRAGLGRTLRWLISGGCSFPSFEPVTNFCYWLIVGLFKVQGPQGFRWFEIALRAADALLVGWIATRWLGRQRWAVMAGLLYLLHPMHQYWSCLGVPHYLATFFVLCGLLLHSGSWERNAGMRTAGLCAAYFLAAFSKESGVLFPLFLLCFDVSISLGEPSPRDFWRKKLVPYLCLSLVALFYVWVRWDFLCAGASSNVAIDVGTRLSEALSASRFAWLLPIALFLPFFARKQPSRSYFARAAFCSAWFVLGILPFLGLIPVALPMHVQGIYARYLFLPMAGLVWLAASAVDFCARRWGNSCGLILALLVFAPCLAGLGRSRTDRASELAQIERGLAQCASPDQPDWNCVSAALSLPLVRREAPESFERLAKTVDGLWPRERAEAFLEFFSGEPFDGSDPKWRCLAQAMFEGQKIEPCVEADRAFRAGNRALGEGRFDDGAAAFHAATGAWPNFMEAYFQRARALALARDDDGAARSYDSALHCPLAYYLLEAVVRDRCGSREDGSCRFLGRIDAERDLDLFQVTGRTWLENPGGRLSARADNVPRR